LPIRRSSIGPTVYDARVAVGLSAALRRAHRSPGHRGVAATPFDAEDDRLVVLSDMHRGKRDRADDFRRCEAAYLAALAHYNREQYTLALLGDVEELWQNRVDAVVSSYADVYGAEAAFHEDRRLIRFWGNHDEEWASPTAVRRELDPLYPGVPLDVRESLLLDVRLGDHSLGSIFLVHGHQGTGMSDGLAFLARFTVRFIWKPIQHLTAVSRNTPSKNRKVREKHHRAMRRWAEAQDDLLLIAGHTHRPVFASVAIVDELERRLGLNMEEIRGRADDQLFWDEIVSDCTDRGWLGDEAPCGPPRESEPPGPHLFNSGCCCFRDGRITGIEMTDGQIRLVLWGGGVSEGRRVLAQADLEAVFERMSLAD
jgi:UDP-2,3-diacylglucosamine pyrophosphatase LpxH